MSAKESYLQEMEDDEKVMVDFLIGVIGCQDTEQPRQDDDGQKNEWGNQPRPNKDQWKQAMRTH